MEKILYVISSFLKMAKDSGARVTLDRSFHQLETVKVKVHEVKVHFEMAPHGIHLACFITLGMHC